MVAGLIPGLDSFNTVRNWKILINELSAMWSITVQITKITITGYLLIPHQVLYYCYYCRAVFSSSSAFSVTCTSGRGNGWLRNHQEGTPCLPRAHKRDKSSCTHFLYTALHTQWHSWLADVIPMLFQSRADVQDFEITCVLGGVTVHGGVIPDGWVMDGSDLTQVCGLRGQHGSISFEKNV